MRPIGIFIVGALAGAGALQLAGHVLQESEPTRVAPAENTNSVKLRLEGSHPHKAENRLPPERQEEIRERSSVMDSRPDAEPGAMSEWNAFVGGMLEWQVEHRTGRRLTAEQRHQLVSELGRLREASLALQERVDEPGDAADLRDRLTQTLVLVEVDQTFRREVGVGVAEFLQALNPSAVEDVSPAP